MPEWEYHPFDEGDGVIDRELQGMFKDRYRRRPDRIKRLKLSAAERRDEQ